MQITGLNAKIDTAHIAPEKLMGNAALTEDQKIGEASQQFEAILLRQFLAESQKPVIQSSLTDNSASAGIYQDFITNQLADSLAHSGGVGLAKTFQQQLSHHHSAAHPAGGTATSTP